MADLTDEQNVVERKLIEAGVFAGMRGLEGLANATEFWDGCAYGTRLYYGRGGLDYLHRDVLGAAIRIIREQPSASEITALREEVESLRAKFHNLHERLKDVLAGLEAV